MPPTKKPVRRRSSEGRPLTVRSRGMRSEVKLLVASNVAFAYSRIHDKPAIARAHCETEYLEISGTYARRWRQVGCCRIVEV